MNPAETCQNCPKRRLNAAALPLPSDQALSVQIGWCDGCLGDVGKTGDRMEKEILSVKEVILKTGLSRTTIHRKEKAGEFPTRRRLSSRKVGWLLSEVVEWVQALPKA